MARGWSRSAPAPLVGRDAELDLAQSVLDDVISGEGRLLLVCGEPGIGKTRLVEELAARAYDDGALVLWGRAEDIDGAPGYWPWVQLLDGLIELGDEDVIATALDASAAPIAAISEAVRDHSVRLPVLQTLPPAAGRFRLHDAIVTLLRRVASRLPLVLVVDDVHWADASSLELTRFVAARLRGASILLVLTYRTVDGGDGELLNDMLATIARDRALERIALDGLSEAEVGRYMAQMSGVRPRAPAVAAMHARTEGNPFFVGEVARLLQDGAPPGQSTDHDAVPTGVRDVVRRRLTRLPEPTRQLLVLAAVLGREFDVELLGACAGLDEGAVVDAVEPALSAGVLQEAAAVGRVSFSHALIRDTIDGELTALRRATIHARIGDALEQRPARTRASLSALARHFCCAAPIVGPDRGLSYSMQASEAHKAALAYERAEDDLRRALSLIELMPQSPERLQQELEVQNRLVALMIPTRGYAAPEVGRACRRARELCQQIGETDALFKTLTNLGGFHHVHGEFGVALEVAEQLLTIGIQRSNATWLACGHALRAMAQLHAGQIVAARDAFASATDAAGELELSARVANTFFGRHPLPTSLVYASRCAWLLGDVTEAQALAAEGVRLAMRLGHPRTLAFCWYFDTHLQILLRDVTAVAASCDRAISFCDEHGLSPYRSWFRLFRGWAMCDLDRVEEGVSEMTAQVAANQASGARLNRSVFLSLLAEGEARRGNPAGALAVVDDAIATRGEDGLWESDLYRRRGELLAVQGADHHREAAEWLRRAIGVARSQDAVAFITRAEAALAALQPAEGRGISAGVGAAASGLTGRERELLGLVGRGLTDKQIAAELVISIATVRSHLDRIRDKTGRRRRPELTRLAVDLEGS